MDKLIYFEISSHFILLSKAIASKGEKPLKVRNLNKAFGFYSIPCGF